MFFFNDTATTEIYTLSLHDALPIFHDQQSGEEKEYLYEGGIVEFVKHLNKNKNMLHEPIYFEKTKDLTQVEIAIQYNDGYNENVYSFANNINTHEGGTHLSGFKTALTRTFNNYAEKNGLAKNGFKVTSEDIKEGLSAIVSVKIPEPQFEGQTKTKLDRKSTRLNSSHTDISRMPSSA